MQTLSARHSSTVRRLNRSKTASFFGGVCLLFNAMTGAGIPFTPSLFATLGWVPPFFLFILFAVISAFSVLFIIESMQAMPGNRHFQGTVEFATLINFFFGPAEHIMGQLILYGAIQSQAMNNIVLSAQTFDHIFVDVFHKTCAIAFPGNGVDFGWYCVSNDQSTAAAVALGASSPFGDQPILFSLGFLSVIGICIPLAISNMDDNIVVQMAAFIITVLVSAEWFIESSFTAQRTRIQSISLSPAFANLLGPIILNFSCAIFVPSWINLKRKSVNVQNTVWVTMFGAVLLFGIIGLFPALAFDDLKLKDAADTPKNIISILSDSMYTPHFAINKVFCYVFSIVMLLPAIPVSFIVSEQNIAQNFQINTPKKKICLKFLTFVLPWVLTIPMQTGSALGVFINYTGVLLISPANFVIPLVIYLKCLKFRKCYNETRELSEKQTRILKQVHDKSGHIQNFLDGKDSKNGERKSRRRTLALITSLTTSNQALSSKEKKPFEAPEIIQLKDPVGIETVAVRIVDWTDGFDNEISVHSEDKSVKLEQCPPNILPEKQIEEEIVVDDVVPAVKMGLTVESNPLSTPRFQKEDDEFWLRESVPDPEEELSEIDLQHNLLSARRPSMSQAFLQSFARSTLKSDVNISPNSNSPIKSEEGAKGARDSEKTLGEFNNFLDPHPPTATTASRSESDACSSVDLSEFRLRSTHALPRRSLPFNPNFISPAFRAVPVWMPIKPYKLALFLLGVTCVLSIVVVVLQFSAK
ncbi:hypothetical protein BDR26DRAFT_528712 [Obelidium mucronatum]|nr:hypothetical protein BDR26DRAFT_528712 [Obelidium mucronatum]